MQCDLCKNIGPSIQFADSGGDRLGIEKCSASALGWQIERLFLRQCGGASPAITSTDDNAFGNSKIKPSHIDCDGFVRGRSIVACRRLIKKADQRYMRYLMAWLILLPSCALAQELSVQDRACITAAAAKLPPVTALKIEGSRVVAQPSAQGQRNSKVSRQGGWTIVNWPSRTQLKT